MVELQFPLWSSTMDTESNLLKEDAYYNIFLKAIGLKPAKIYSEESKGIHTHFEFVENARLKVVNEKFCSEDIKLGESLTKASCVTWCNPQAIADFFLDEHQLKVENPRLKEVAHLEFVENACLKVENEKFCSGNIKLSESLIKASCVTWCNPQARANFFLMNISGKWRILGLKKSSFVDLVVVVLGVGEPDIARNIIVEEDLFRSLRNPTDIDKSTAMYLASCVTWRKPQAIDNFFLDEHQLKVENSRLKEEIAAKYVCEPYGNNTSASSSTL
ncbi:hypothetical protein ACH5RR_023020 [Cinchona calisaya]|uniref:Uncharacterized protein n=1 Tax=Cinchona calisaya TaxID=153742 RepID=A0ABD2Z9I5_9GENT